MSPGGRSESVDQEQPTNAQIMEMLGEYKARADEQQRRIVQVEAENRALKATTERVEAENIALKAGAQRVEARAERVEAELERQRLEKLSLASRVNEVEGGPAPQDKKLSRAGLFKAAAMGSAAVVGAQALGTLGAEHAAAATTDTNFIATGTVSNFDARGTTTYGLDTSLGSFNTGANLQGTSWGVSATAFGASSRGIYASGGKYGAELAYGSGGVPLYLTPGGVSGAPTTGSHLTGEIYVDSTGRVYHCATAGTPGAWVPMNALIPVPPVRVLDSRSGTHVGTSTGPFTTGSILTVPIAGQTFATSSGSFTFPSNTIGVAGNLIAVTPTGAGYLVAYPTGTTLPTAASVNFVPPGTGADIYYSLGNHITTALSASGQLNISVGLVAGANVQIVLDIAGYLV